MCKNTKEVMGYYSFCSTNINTVLFKISITISLTMTVENVTSKSFSRAMPNQFVRTFYTVLSLLCYFNYHRPSQDFSSLEPFLMWSARITEVERDLARSSYPNYIVPSTTHEHFDEHHGFGCSLISKSGFILKSPYIIF